jgi:hypothetical protein
LLTRIEVGDLHDAALDPLQLVAAARGDQQAEDVGHLGNHGLGLADADGLDQHHVVPRRLGQRDGLARAPGDAAKRVALRWARGG